jgi:hypothetical protein
MGIRRVVRGDKDEVFIGKWFSFNGVNGLFLFCTTTNIMGVKHLV